MGDRRTSTRQTALEANSIRFYWRSIFPNSWLLIIPFVLVVPLVGVVIFFELGLHPLVGVHHLQVVDAPRRQVVEGDAWQRGIHKRLHVGAGDLGGLVGVPALGRGHLLLLHDIRGFGVDHDVHQGMRGRGAAPDLRTGDQHEEPGGHSPDGRVAGDLLGNERLVMEVVVLPRVDLRNLPEVILLVVSVAGCPSLGNDHPPFLHGDQAFGDFGGALAVVDVPGDVDGVAAECEVLVRLDVDGNGPIVLAAAAALDFGCGLLRDWRNGRPRRLHDVQEEFVDLAFLFVGGVVHDRLQTVPDVAPIVEVEGAGHGRRQEEPEWENVLALPDAAVEAGHLEAAVVVVVVVPVGPPVLPRAFPPVDVLVPDQPDHQIPIGPGLLGVEVDAAFDELPRRVDGFADLHVEVDVLVLDLRRAHE